MYRHRIHLCRGLAPALAGVARGAERDHPEPTDHERPEPPAKHGAIISDEPNTSGAARNISHCKVRSTSSSDDLVYAPADLAACASRDYAAQHR
jgi:hypothetical protein